MVVPDQKVTADALNAVVRVVVNASRMLF